MKVFKLYSAIQKVSDYDDNTLEISGYASTASVDRVGDIILPEAWSKGGLDNFKKNPIILFNHNYGEPVGRATDLEIDERGLKITARISKGNPKVHALVKDEVLSTFSVGFMIKDLDYNETTDGFLIRDAELLEVSVVAVPCNQDATFSLKKSFENAEEYKKFVQKELHIIPGQEEKEVKTSTTDSPEKDKNVPGKKLMDEEQVLALVNKAAADAIAAERARVEAAEKAAAEKKAEEERIKAAAEAATKSVEEKLIAEMNETVAKAVKDTSSSYEEKFAELSKALEERTEEIKAMRGRKVQFDDRKGSSSDAIKAHLAEAEDAFLVSKILKKKFEDTEIGKSVLEKVNAHSTVTVGSDALETTVGTNIEREIWNDLILAPLFREIRMNSATQTFQIMPDAGYAEITANTTASGTQPNGNMDRRGAPHGAPYEGLTLSDVELKTVKMIAKSYLGDETEEDAIIPILPLIREAMARSHQRGIENMLLAGNDVDGVYTSGAANGLIKLARTNGRMVSTAATDTTLTASALLGMRRVMGKYGLRPDDLVYIVSQHAYFDLMEDAEFQDADLVGNQATKLTGQVGLLYGSRVMICDEFAAPAAGKVFALALNRRNFVVPRLRDLRVQSDYQVEQQRQVLISSQRLGFAEIIPDATSVVALKYADA